MKKLQFKNFYIKYLNIYLLRFLIWFKYIPGFTFKTIRQNHLHDYQSLHGIKSKTTIYKVYFMGYKVYSKLLTVKEEILLRFFFLRLDKRHKKVFQTLAKNLPKKSLFLEIGAGTGVVSKYFSHKFSHSILIEPDNNMFRFLEEFRTEQNISLFLKKIQSSEDIFDLINSHDFSLSECVCFGSSVLPFLNQPKYILNDLDAKGVSFVFVEGKLLETKIPSKWIKHLHGLILYSNCI